MIFEEKKDDFLITTDKNKLSLKAIHAYLSRSYWSENIPIDRVEKAIQNSLCFGLFHQKDQIGFARLITDYTSFAYLADVYVLEEFRGKGLSKWLMTCIKKQPNLQNLRRWMLATKDAHSLYEKFGFTSLKNPNTFMELHQADVYKK